VPVLNRQGDVPDVPVERVSVEQQEEGGHEDDRHQGPAIAPDLSELFPIDGQGPSHDGSEWPRPSDSPTRALARPSAVALRWRRSLAVTRSLFTPAAPVVPHDR